MCVIIFSVMSVTKNGALGLYKKLLRFSDELIFTDKEYFVRRVREEFLRNKVINSEADLIRKYKVLSTHWTCVGRFKI